MLELFLSICRKEIIYELSCTKPRYAVQFLENGEPKRWDVYDNDNTYLKTITEPLTFFKYRENLIITAKYNGNLSDYMHNQYPHYEEGKDYRVLYVPCGKCAACRLAYAKNWAIRGMLEAHELIEEQKFESEKEKYSEKKLVENSFLTLTLNDTEVLNENKHGKFLRLEYLQKFIKRLRKELSKDKIKIRYLACGEYGSLSMRPHYHLIVFGWYPKDVELEKVNACGDRVYISSTLEKLWTFGHIFIGDVTPESISYVAGYVTKKQEIVTHLQDDCYEYKEHLPFITMSRKPGLGYKFFEKYTEDFILDELHIGKNKYQVPRYFMKKFEEYRPDVFEKIKVKRLIALNDNFKNTLTPKRLEVLDELYNLRLAKKVRNL